MAQSTPTHASDFHLVIVAMTGHAEEMGLIRLQCIYFSKHFALVLDSNLHDLNETNPD